MYLVRSVGLEHLSEADRLRRGLIAHFARPYGERVTPVDARGACESPLERALYDWLVERGYRVTPQAAVGAWRIDLVVEGAGDARLAVECDGDKDHLPEHWTEDVRRQRALERVGWAFWRCFAATFVRRPDAVLRDLAAALAEAGVEPMPAAGQPARQPVERRVVRVDWVEASPAVSA
jgi:very-short-patch-repair endonuclease